MSLRVQAALLMALCAALCAGGLKVIIEGAVLSSQNADQNMEFFGVLLLALVSGFLAGWILGPIFGQNGIGGFLLGLIGAFLATGLASALAGAFMGAANAFIFYNADPLTMFGSALLHGAMFGYLIPRLLFSSAILVGLWLLLFLSLQVFMAQHRRHLAEED